MPGCFSRLMETVRGRRQPTASTGCLNSFVGCFCCLFQFCRVRDRWEVDSDFEEVLLLILESKLDEVQLDVPQLPVILDVQDAAIILEDVPDVPAILEEATGNWQLIPIRFSPLYCGPVVIRNNAGPVAKALRTFQFISPIITYIGGGSQCVAGRATQYASQLRHETSVNVTLGCYQQTDVSVAYAILHMGLDGLLSSSAWSEAASVSTPTNQQFTEPEPESHNCYEGWEEDLLPEERAVPLLNLYLTTKRVEDIALRLVSLRQGFTDEAEFIRAYNDFVAYLSDPSKQIDIERELAEAKLHHVNLIDVLFELVLFGMMTAQKSMVVHPGGFMERLYALLYSFLPADASIEPKAERYLLLLNGRLMALLDDMFGQQLAWYFNPESLVTELSSLLEYHLENLMASM